jgi:transcription antitermination factor NusA-like protein
MTKQEFLENLLAHMGCAEYKIDITEDETTITVVITVPEEESGMFICHRGENTARNQDSDGVGFPRRTWRELVS